MVLLPLLLACSNDYGVTVQPDPEVVQANDDPVTEIFINPTIERVLDFVFAI